VKYKNIPAKQAAREVVEALKQTPVLAEYASPVIKGVEGGVIVLDRKGNFTACYNAAQMSRATITRSGKVKVLVIEAPPRGAAAPPPHPLDPLSAAEMDRAADILRHKQPDGQKLPEGVLFPVLTLHEPPKKKVLAFDRGRAVPRQAFAVVYDPKKNETWEGIIDLSANRVKKFNQVPGVQPRLLGAEYEAVVLGVRQNKDVIAALKRRDINDPDKNSGQAVRRSPAAPTPASAGCSVMRATTAVAPTSGPSPTSK
jgi:Cu2+-containing amine oxidase